MDPIVIKTNYKNTDTIVDLLLSAHIMQARLSVTVVCHGCVHSGWILGINTAPQVSSLCWIMRLMVLDDRCTSVGECKYNGRHFIFAVYAITPFRPVATPPPLYLPPPLSLYIYHLFTQYPAFNQTYYNGLLTPTNGFYGSTQCISFLCKSI